MEQIKECMHDVFAPCESSECQVPIKNHHHCKDCGIVANFDNVAVIGNTCTNCEA